MKQAFVLGVIVISLATMGLVVGLTVGAPHPGDMERAFAGVVGLVGCSFAIVWLRGPVDSEVAGAAPDRLASGRGGHEDAVAHPSVTAVDKLERSLRLGRVLESDYRNLVEPRLASLARARMERRGVALADSERAAGLLGTAYRLVDPRQERSADRMAIGRPISQVAELVDALEELE